MNRQQEFVDSLRNDMKSVAESVLKEMLAERVSEKSSGDNQVLIRRAIMRALHGAYFNFLAMLDGSHPLQFEGDNIPFEYELLAIIGGSVFKINDPDKDELISYWNTDEWLDEVYG